MEIQTPYDDICSGWESRANSGKLSQLDQLSQSFCVGMKRAFTEGYQAAFSRSVDKGGTHDEECWRIHHECSIALIERLLKHHTLERGRLTVFKSLYLALNGLQAEVDGVDNGHCRLCHGHRFCNTRGIPQRCENPDCLSTKVSTALDDADAILAKLGEFLVDKAPEKA